MATTKFCQGISDISDSYAGFILDQRGVLHDGSEIYDGVMGCLEELKGRNKRIIILSNSSLSAADNAARLKKIGIGPEYYDLVVTSAEIVRQNLQKQDQGPFRNIGQNCLLLSRNGNTSLIDGLDIKVVSDPSEASFMLITGSDAPEKTMEGYYEPLLKEAARKRLKAICANPDSKSLIGGKDIFGTSALAKRYEDFGGVVHHIGKPHSPIFQYCIRQMHEWEVYPGQIVVVGDTMAHDIIGAAVVSLDTCLVQNGTHAGIFRKATDPSETDKTLTILSAQHNFVKPTYLVSDFVWGKALPDRKHKKRKA